MQENSYKKKYLELSPWLVEILHVVKKELKSEHLKKDYRFCQKYFQKKFVDKLSIEELAPAYQKELEENEELGDLIATNWVMKNAEVYQLFAEKLYAIQPNFDEIEEIKEKDAELIQEAASQAFGAKTAYIFSILNGVAFSTKDLERLRKRALEEVDVKEKEDLQPLSSLEVEKKIAKICQKYEERLLGLQRKYTQDVEGLKKQIAQLQRKLASHG